MKLLLAFVILLGCSLFTSAQIRQVELSSKTPCGSPELPPRALVSGTIAKRDFADDEMTLIGFVVRNGRDQRTYVNVDAEFIRSAGATVSSDLSRFLTTGKRVKLSVYRCRRLLTLRRIL